MTRLATFVLFLGVAGCSSIDAGNGASSPAASENDAVRVIDNVTSDGDAGWAYVSPTLTFDPKSPAQSLPRPAALAGAVFGYFGDAVMTRQYSRAQLMQMKADRAGFTMTRDLDGDGVAETYRTGFWRIGDPRSADVKQGSFLAVFDPGRPPQIIDTSSDYGTGVFISASSDNLVVADCNCRFSAAIRYHAKRLTVTWSN